MQVLYVFALSNSKYFVYAMDGQTSAEVVDSTVYMIAATSNTFVQENLPITETIEKTHIYDISKIDATVKKYMHKYGYDNVRGGSYSNAELTESQIENLERELLYMTIQSVPTKADREIVKFTHEYLDKLRCMTPAELDAEHTENDLTYSVYLRDKNAYTGYATTCYKIGINETTYQRIQTLRSTLNDIYIQHTGLYRPQYKHFIHAKEQPLVCGFYNRIVVKLRELYAFSKMVGCNIPENLQVYLAYPQFILDDYIYHKHYVTDPARFDQAGLVLNAYENLTTYHINRLTELEHDLSTYTADTPYNAQKIETRNSILRLWRRHGQHW